MPQVTVFDMSGKSVGEMSLSDAIFGIEPNQPVMHAAVVNYLANQRQGTQSTLTRSEVAGGGRKPWKHCPGPKTKGLQLFSQQKSEEIGAEIRTFF